ncbi:MAG: caspase family protein [Clostridia bacterium]|nr:caspase family protein [Clostridia bacterium]
MKKALIFAAILIFILSSAGAEETSAPVCRVLSCSITRYSDGRERVGGYNSAQGIYDAFAHAYGSEIRFEGKLLPDAQKSELISEIGVLFAGADQNDISVIYISTHGYSVCGISMFEDSRGDVLSAYELERALRSIPGRIIVLLDFCASGGFIGNAGQGAEALTNAFTHNTFASGKYLVLASCAENERSFRVASEAADEKHTSTAFARALCEGMGWDLINDMAVPLKADADKSRTVTFAELAAYTRRRAMYYLSASSQAVQNVCALPQADGFVIVSRAGSLGN